MMLRSQCNPGYIATLLAGDDAIKWRSNPYLDQERSSTNCSFQYREPIDIEFDGHVVKTGAWLA
jgi:hypothetical protein